MASNLKTLRYFSFSHVTLAILAVITGIASVNVTDYYFGLFGMGIWLGGWILLTGLAGMATAAKPRNYCRIGVFLGCCLVAIVVLIICAIVVGSVVITHFRFESTVTRDYYKNRGTFGQMPHEDYFKPEQYFEDRNKAGKVGLAVYICLLVIICCDVLLSTASVYVCRDLTMTHEQAPIAGTNNRRVTSTSYRQANSGPITQANTGTVPIAGQNWAELVFHGMPAGQMQQFHFIQNPDVQFFTPYKLPNYAELYPVGIPNSALDVSEQTLVADVPDEPPPEYTPTAITSLPGSSVVVPLNSLSTPAAEDSIVEDSTISVRTLTPSAERTRLAETLGGSSNSLQLPITLENSPEYSGRSTPVHSLHPGDLASALPGSLTPSSLETDLSCTPVASHSELTLAIRSDSSTRVIQNRAGIDSSGSLPNSVQVETLQDLHGTVSYDSQNETANFEHASVTAADDTSETR